MNFKPNAWTLLFVLAVGALSFNIYGGEKSDLAVIDSCSNVLDTISTEQAFDMLSDYATYLVSNRDLMDSLMTRKGGVENPDVIYFKIPKCELQQMVKSIPGGQVTAYLGVKTNPNSGKAMIDLFFSDRDMTNINISEGAEMLVANGEGDRFWDFTSPCPTLCNE
jgi:hypothetical protein